MVERLQRWTEWAGGPVALGVILAIQLVMVAVFAVEPTLILGLIGAFAGVVAVLEWPLVGVAGLIAARLFSTGAVVFFRVGSMSIGPFEPALLLCAAALIVRATTHRLDLWQAFPWRGPYVALLGWITLSLAWSANRSEGIGDVIPLFIVIANTAVILTFVRTWDHFRWMMMAWLAGTALVGVVTLALDYLGIQVGSVQWEAAAGGGRETGLGQQPNWYAMNLMFGILPGFGLALLERRRWARWGYMLTSVFVTFMMLKAGSRGGIYSVLIGVVIMALAHPVFRRWAVRFGLGVGLMFVVGIVSNLGESAKAFLRIAGTSIAIQNNYRPLNWKACWEMFVDSYGVGIGAGAYTALLPTYNAFIASSLYDYPHGIFWEVMSHYGVVGIWLLLLLVWRVAASALELVRSTKGTAAEVFAWIMPATMLGYAVWSWVEFTLIEKPFWEFLALYTALQLVVKRAHAAGEVLPAWGTKAAGDLP